MITKPIAPILESKISGFSLRLNASSRSYSISCCTNRSHGHVGAQFLFISWVAASSEHDSARIMYARMNAADLQCTTSSELCTSAQRKRGRVQLPEDIAWMLHLPPRRCTGGGRGGHQRSWIVIKKIKSCECSTERSRHGSARAQNARWPTYLR